MDYKKAREIYRNAILEAKAKGLTYDQALAYGKAALYSEIPDMKTSFGYHSAFWAGEGGFVMLVYGIEKTQISQEINITGENKRVRDRVFSNKMRSAARTGFIPFEKHLEVFLNGEKKPGQISAYVSFLKGEGFEFEKDAYGWITTKFPKPPEPIKPPEPPKPELTTENLLKMLLERLSQSPAK